VPPKNNVTAPVEAPKVVALKSKKDRKVEYHTLFSIDDKEYQIPTKIRPNQGLQIMDAFRRFGDTGGVSFMLETLLGTNGYNALMTFEDLEDEDPEAIVEIAFKLVQDSTSEKSKN
jgi:hypothetical protein